MEEDPPETRTVTDLFTPPALSPLLVYLSVSQILFLTSPSSLRAGLATCPVSVSARRSPRSGSSVDTEVTAQSTVLLSSLAASAGVRFARFGFGYRSNFRPVLQFASGFGAAALGRARAVIGLSLFSRLLAFFFCVCTVLLKGVFS